MKFQNILEQLTEAKDLSGLEEYRGIDPCFTTFIDARRAQKRKESHGCNANCTFKITPVLKDGKKKYRLQRIKENK